MNKTFYLKLGNLHMTKKAVLILAFGFLLTGILLGGLIFISVKSNESFNSIYFMWSSIFIWFFTFRSLKNEVVEKSSLK